jgi:hypothetical protein
MFKLRKIKIRNLFTTIFLINIILLSFLITLIFIRFLNNLEEFSNKENSDNIKQQIATLLLHDVKIKGNYYSFLFQNASNVSEIIAEQFATLSRKVKDGDIKLNKSQKINLELSKEGILYNNFQFNNKAFVIFQEGLAQLDKTHEDDLYLLNQIKSLPLDIKNYSDYITDIWIVTKNNTACFYPNIYTTEALGHWKVSLKTVNNYRKIASARKNFVHRTIWSKLHRNALGKLQMTIVTPVLDDKKKRIGLVGVSLSLYSVLAEILGDTSSMKKLPGDSFERKLIYKQFPGAFSFIIDVQGDLVAFPPQMESLFSIVTMKDEGNKKMLNLGTSSNVEVQKLADEMIKDLDGIYPLKLHGEKYLVAFSTLTHSSWTLGVVIPEYDLMASIRDTKHLVEKTKTNILVKVISITAVMLIIFALINFVFFKRFLLNPILNVCSQAAKIGKGDFDIDIEENKILEIATISKTLGDLGGELKNYMNNIKNEIKSRQSIETEVNIATDIQQSVIPEITKDFKRDEFDLCAKIYKSSSITGDFYDFFYIDAEKTKLVLVIADVSGKGIPAAFYMAVIKILIRNACHRRDEKPGKALTEANKILCMDVQSNMFAGALIMYYDLTTDKISYANAAHREAFLLKQGIKCKQLTAAYGRVLGKNSDVEYKTVEIDLAKGEKLVLCTNGLIRAVSDNRKYKDSINHFKEFLTNNNNLTCSDMVQMIDSKICNRKFVDETGGVSVIVFEKQKRTKADNGA